MAIGNDNVRITVLSIECNETSESPHKDEVYFHYKIDDKKAKRYPEDGYVSMDQGDTWTINLVIDYQTSLSIQLYDNDTAGDDLLGEHNYTPEDATPGLELNTPVSNPNGASYVISTVGDEV